MLQNGPIYLRKWYGQWLQNELRQNIVKEHVYMIRKFWVKGKPNKSQLALRHTRFQTSPSLTNQMPLYLRDEYHFPVNFNVI